MESNDDTYESEKEYEKNMYASGNAEDYMNEVEDEEEWNRVQADSSVKVDEAGERTGGKRICQNTCGVYSCAQVLPEI